MNKVLRLNHRYLQDEDGEYYSPIVHVDSIQGLNEATLDTPGLMSKEDKQKLNSFIGTDSNSKLGSVFYKEVKNNDNNAN